MLHASITLPRIDRDYWELLLQDNPKPQQTPDMQSWPDPFPIGHSIKLIFWIELLKEDGQTSRVIEAMWATVTEKHEDVYIGLLENQPHSFSEDSRCLLARYVEIPFKRKHAIDYLPREAEFQEFAMSLEPSRTWPRNYD